ncbi:hypothetical protein [Peribacillus frigoritolerans]|uniref:hypothetical protein n=1 Tax=Peribacillus frigoritolerans TaxID=450367 RepID=UPI003F7D8F5B
MQQLLFLRQKIRETVKKPVVAEQLIPDYPLGAKRVCLDTNYFETYNRDNVQLINMKKSPIEEISSTDIKTSNEEYELDMIIFAIGYDALTGPLLKMDIRGKNGVALKDKREDGAKLETYLGLASTGFPNLFKITVPQSPAVHGNIPILIEQHLEWISECIKYLRYNDGNN